MKRVLLTGAGGAIGVHMLCHIMHNTDWHVVGLDSFKPEHKGDHDRIGEVLRNHPDWKPRLTIVQRDLRARFTRREVDRFGRIDYVLNLASRSDVPNSLEDPEKDPTGASDEFVLNNVEIMLTMLGFARMAKPEKFLQFSTDEVYGPAPMHSDGHKEGEPHRPSNPYSASKAMQEDLCFAWWRCYKLPIIVTNTMNNFGEMQAPSKFPAMIQQRVEAGEEIQVHANDEGVSGTRYYIHSRNASDAVIFILRNVEPRMHAPGEIDELDQFNIVGDQQLSNEELVISMAAMIGKKAIYRKVNFHDHNPGHDLHYGLDGAKLAALGWRSPMTFEQSMRNTIEWNREHPEWCR